MEVDESNESDSSVEEMEIIVHEQDDEEEEEEEEEEQEEQEEMSSALIVESKELQALSISLEDSPKKGKKGSPKSKSSPSKSKPKRRVSSTEEEEEPEEPQPGPSSRIRRRVSSSSEEEEDAEEDGDEVIDPEEEIRKATAKYLQGEMSATNFATMMEDYERYKAQSLSSQDKEEETEEEEDERKTKTKGPSLVLLNPDKPPLRSPSVPVPEIILTEEEIDEEEGRKLRGEFFRTGNETATFTIRRTRKMPVTVKNMMGEAHVRFARGDLTGAESVCLEVIKEQPTYKDPFHTLAMIYESQGRSRKALQFFLICGLLDPKHFDDWPRLAELSMEEGNVSQAIMCLRKAIVCDPSNIRAHIRRCELLMEIGDLKGAMRGLHKSLPAFERDPSTYMDIAKRIAGIHFKESELDQAYEVLMSAFSKCSAFVTTAEMNLVAEVCIALKRYVKAVTLFMRYSGVRFDPAVPRGCFKERNTLTIALNENNRRCVVPIGLHSDLVQKLCIVLIHLEGFTMVQPIVTKLREAEPLETFGIQLYEIAEAYLAKQQYISSLEILTILIKTEQYSKAEIWLRYAECLFLLNRVEESADAYSKVIELAPGHKIARLNLSVILQKLGRYDTALQSLDQPEVEDFIDQDLLVEKCNILLSRGRTVEFVETAFQLFTRHCPDIRNHDEAHALVLTSQTNQMIQGLKLLRAKRGDPIDDDLRRIQTNSSDNAVGEWSVYINLYRLILQLNRPDLLCRLVYTVWASPLFNRDERMKKDLDIQSAYAAIMNHDNDLSRLHIRSLINTFGLSTMILKLMSLSCRNCGHSRHGRQILRLFMKRPSDTRLMLLSAHTSFMNGTYKYALMEYLDLLKRRPKDPLLHLMIATTFLHIASQKHTSNRSEIVSQGIAFISKYAQLRGDCQETYYNLGRFYHFIGFYQQAMSYYKRVLITDPVEDKTHPDYNISDLRREAAFNIAQIYKNSGFWMLAKRYIYRYCSI